MGDDAKSSVVNRYCQAHDVDNLFIADTSVFVTCGGLNPSLTAQALAYRTAEHIARQWEGKLMKERQEYLYHRRELLALSGVGIAFARGLLAAAQSFRVGHATTTHLHYRKETASFWTGVEELSALGFRGTEADDMIARLSEVYRDQTAGFRERMARHKMTLPVLYHTLPEDFLARNPKELMTHLMRVGRFIQEVGGSVFNLSGPDPVPKGDRREQIRGICRVANELGARLRDELGLRAGYHPESESVFQGREDISVLMDGTKPESLT